MDRMEKPPGPQKRPAIRRSIGASYSKESTDNYINNMRTRSTTQAAKSSKSDNAASDDINPESEEDSLNIEESNSIGENTNQPKKRLKKQERLSSDNENENANSKPRSVKTDSLKRNSTKVKEPLRLSKNSEPYDSQSSFNLKVPIVAVLLTIIVLFLVSYSSGRGIGMPSWKLTETESDSTNKLRMDSIKEKIKKISSHYKNQARDLWREVYIGITNRIREPKKPSIILLLGNRSEALDCLAVLFGDVSSSNLETGKLSLTPSEFPTDMGAVIESLRSKMEEKRVVVIQDLLNINVEALKAFHNLCDRINPLVEEVMFIITIISDDYDGQSKPIKFVEEKLYKKLKGKMKEDAIQPLITRITDGPILTVMAEPSISSCPLLDS
ncbi:hypothetical protein QAD02_004739 [Eretmocerus hayati]|uniref:Uncharacterized protein n=1 Tax=Eretmocerus hayati TaxID=131215 RepID=A0ACC2NQT1_9HYME|nr:hypothetical protein QAD02_004739 [Eretmocerus hayati]